ncbi:hypothetical protein [Methylobacterium sp. J-067]|uniref:hypothetical protein n=1 Tax=Methylobacterium sp. J-067 TaxID=2836648 RepID=UPI001FB8F4C7|nr:hypothetical protein [Methylobacterium sp. J-067]MCJ2024019.1 hypothetical protein [Methylobacterium sp. J-067]
MAKPPLFPWAPGEPAQTGDIGLLEALGPLAAMHAALDAVGAGIPCGIMARLEGRNVAEVEDALHRAALRFPLLRQRLVWRHGKPRSVCDATAPLGPHHDPAFSLAFRVGPQGRPWSYDLKQAGRDVWLRAVFAHAIADGYSMLHFLGTVVAEVEATDYHPPKLDPRPATSPRSFRSWLPGFLALQGRSFASIATHDSEPGVVWTTVPLAEVMPLLSRVQSELGGFGSLLAASASLAVARAARAPFAHPVLLNLQVMRSRLAAFNGFGFGAGSVMLPVHVGAGDEPTSTARSIATRARRLVDEDWDGNLNKMIGQSPVRHRLMARLKSRQSCDPTLTVSWKPRPVSFGREGSVQDVACFASSSGTHVSAHLDQNGLSLSLTNWQAETARVAMFDDLLRGLGVRSTTRYLHCADPVAAGETAAARGRPAWTRREPAAGAHGGIGPSHGPAIPDPMPSGTA